MFARHTRAASTQWRKSAVQAGVVLDYSVFIVYLTMDDECSSKMDSVSNLSTYFLNHDNSKNTILASYVPQMCKDEPCVLGVDEAGRGPVLGPMVYGICYCPLTKTEILKDVGCADSKSLTEIKREEIFEKLCNNKDTVGWVIEAIAPNTICNNMLRRHKYSLNLLAQDSTVQLIKKAIDQGVHVAEVYVDTVGMPDKYQEKLLAIFPELKITVAKKADATYPVVSAASICAKVTRDRALQVWTFREGLNVTSEGFGSGYPNDPVTKKFLVENIDPVFGFPQLVRFSWSTASRLLQDHAINVEWEDVEDDNPPASTTSILPFLKLFSEKGKKTKHTFFKERHLTNTKDL